MDAPADLPILYVEDDNALKALCDRLRGGANVALDTEFMRSKTFYPILALIQVATDSEIAIIDPLAISDWSAFVDVLTDEAITKVIHSGSEDIETLHYALGKAPFPLLDTQIFAAFDGMGSAIGYAKMVAELFDEALEKSATLTDWLQRPLSAEQLEYAALDVKFLLAIAKQLRQSLQEKDLLAWAQEDCARMATVNHTTDDKQFAYRRVKNTWQLDEQQLAVLQALAAWREGEARARNLVRNFVVHEVALHYLAQQQPAHNSDLGRVPKLTRKQMQRYGDALLACIEQGKSVAENERPNRVRRMFEFPNYKVLSKKLKHGAQEIAGEHGIPPEVLYTKRMIDRYIKCCFEQTHGAAALRGWRQDLLEKKFDGIWHDVMRDPLLEDMQVNVQETTPESTCNKLDDPLDRDNVAGEILDEATAKSTISGDGGDK